MSIIANDNDPGEFEDLSYEFHRLMGIAEAFTGAEALRQKLPKGDYLRAIEMLSGFIKQEQEMREAQLVPYTLEDMKKRIDQAVDKDTFYQREL